MNPPNQDQVEPAPPSPAPVPENGNADLNTPVQFTNQHVMQLLERLQVIDQNFERMNERMNQFSQTLGSMAAGPAGGGNQPPPPPPAPTVVAPAVPESAVRRYKPVHPEPFTGKPETLLAWIELVNIHLALNEISDDVYALHVAKQFLSPTVMNWLQTLSSESANPMGWSDLQERMKLYYKVQNEEDRARAELSKLRQRTSVRKYTNEYNKLILKLPMLSEEDKLYEFKKGLKTDVKIQVELRGYTNMTELKAAADRVDDLLWQASGRRGRRDEPSASGNEPKPDVMEIGNLSAEERDRYRKEGRCFESGEKGHLASKHNREQKN